MQINWFGLAYFRIITREASVVIDPYNLSVGLKPPRLSADILLLTSDREAHGNQKAVSGGPFLVSGPGEYEVKNVFIWGHAIDHNGDKSKRTTVYVIEAEDLSVAHLGDLNVVLTEEQLDRLEGVDILMIPVGGHHVLDARRASAMISAIEPRVVIPMYYKSNGIKLPLDSLEAFSKEFGIKESEKLDKLKISKKDLPQDETKVVVLQS
ncbi:MAG: MBL fold metallo-hydrolase [bacterium]